MNATRSRPLPSGRRMSVRQRSKLCACRSRRAAARVNALCVSRCMRLSVRLTSSSRSGSSSTIRTSGLLIFGPAVRVGEHQAEDTAAAGSRLVQKRRAIGLRKLTREEETQTRTAVAAREEWLEDAFMILRRHPRTAIGDLKIRSQTGAQAAIADFDRRSGGPRRRVPQHVVAQIPDHLPQLTRIDTHVELHFDPADG